MKLHHHTLISLSISGLLYMTSKSAVLAISSFIAGVFIDLDHFVDVIREHGRNVKISEFFHLCHNSQFNKIVLFWHGWEWTALLSIAAWLTSWNPWITGTLIGITQHLILDTIYNGSGINAYSILWRWHKRFDFDTIFSGQTRYKYAYRKDLPGSNN